MKFFAEYSTRPKKERDRSKQLNRLKLQICNFQKPHRPPQDVKTYILMIPDTQQVSTQAVQGSQVAAPQPPTVIVTVQPQRSSSVASQPASFLVVDDQQSGPSRQLMFALSPTKTFNPPSIAHQRFLKHFEKLLHAQKGIVFCDVSILLKYMNTDLRNLMEIKTQNLSSHKPA